VRALLGVIGAVLTVAYPLAVYFGLSRFSVRAVSLLLLCLALPMIALRMRGKKREHLVSLLPVPISVIALIALSAILEDHRFMLALPVLISAALLVTFGASLASGTPMIERFARMQRPDLPPDHAVHCRQVTWVWCGFFVVNGAIASVLAIRGPLEWWTLYSGLIAYVLMGVLFAAEYVVRKYRFRHEERSH
jgi:uncharacterized membrane protein